MHESAGLACMPTFIQSIVLIWQNYQCTTEFTFNVAATRDVAIPNNIYILMYMQLPISLTRRHVAKAVVLEKAVVLVDQAQKGTPLPRLLRPD